MKIASGTVLDRPWGQTLGTIGVRKLDAQVTVQADDGKSYAIVFVKGQVTAAMSPLPNDSVTRVALTSHFVSPVQVREITQRLATENHRDEVEIVAEAGKLSADHVATLRRRLTVQRAARTFAIDRGTFDIDDQITLPYRGDFAIPLGSVIFQGVRMNLSEQRLIEDMRELGTSFHLRPTVTDADIAEIEIEGDIRSIIAALRKGTSLAELELASHRDIEPRTLHAMIYAFVCTGMCDAAGGQPVDRTAPPAPRTATGLAVGSHATIKVDQPLVTRSRNTLPPTNAARGGATLPPTNVTGSATPPPVARTTTPPPISHTTPPPMARTTTPPPTARTTTPPPTARTTTPPPAGHPTSPPPSATSPPLSRTATPLPGDRARTGSQPPTSRASSTQPFASRTSTGSPPSRTTTPTTQPPLRSATMPPRSQTNSSSPLDDFIKETTTNRGFSSIDEFRRDTTTTGSGPHPIVDEFRREPSTSRGISPITVTPALPRTITKPRTITERDRAKKEIEALIATRLAKLEQACDHFAILGLPFEAPLDAVRNNYVETSRRLHPDSLSQVGIVDGGVRAAQRVLAQVNAAFNTLTDPAKRRDYINAVRRGEPTPMAPRARTGDLDKSELAAEAFENGESALKRDDILRAVEELGRAVTLAPTNLEYIAMLAWAQFCAANDKTKVYIETRKALERAIHRGDKPIVARFYLGRVERMVGHDREALNHFQEVLLDEPNNREAASEARVLEQKLARGTKKR